MFHDSFVGIGSCVTPPLPTSAITATMAPSPLLYSLVRKGRGPLIFKGPGTEIMYIKFLHDKGPRLFRGPRNPLTRYMNALRISVQGDNA